MLLPSALTATGTLRVEKNGDVLVNVYVVPNAAVTQVTGLYNNAPRVSIRLKLQATPVNGNANTALRKWLAHCLGVLHGSVTLVRGNTSQHKQLRVSNDAANWSALLSLLAKAAD